MGEPARKLIPSATIDDLLAIPEEKRWHEIIDGELIQRALPSPAHGYTQVTIGARLRDPYGGPPERRGPGGWWIFSDTDVELAPHQIYRPDLIGFRRERMPVMPKEWPIRIRPDWVCEILSPSNYTNDTLKKFRNYHRYQVPYYWIIDPQNHIITVYRYSEPGYVVLTVAGPGEKVNAEPFEAVELDVGELFGDLEAEAAPSDKE